MKYLSILSFLIIFSISLAAQDQVGQTLYGTLANNNSGWSIDLSNDGTILAIGSPWYNDPISSDVEGKVEIFKLADNVWEQMGSSIKGRLNESTCGWALDLSADGNILAVGIPNFSSSGDGAGIMKIFEFDGMGWEQLGLNINGSGFGGGDFSSVSISADGMTVAGNRFVLDDPFSPLSHISYASIHTFDGGRWVEIEKDFAGYRGGNSIVLSNNGLRMGVGYKENYGLSPGNVDTLKIFDFKNDHWEKTGEFIRESIDGIFSTAFSFSENGNRLALGNSSYDGTIPNAGQVNIYDYNGTEWLPVGSTIENIPGDLNTGLTTKLSNDGSRVLIGALTDDNIPNLPQLLLYEFNGTDWVHIAAGLTRQYLPMALSGDGQSIAFGDPFDSSLITYSGKASVYKNFKPNLTHWVDSTSQWYCLINPEATSGGHVQVALDNFFYSEQEEAVIYNYSAISNWIDPIYCELESYVQDSLLTWVKDSIIYLNGDTIACFKNNIDRWSYVYDWGGDVVNYNFHRKEMKTEDFGLEPLKGYTFDLSYLTFGGDTIKQEELSFFEAIGFLESRLDFYDNYPLFISSTNTPICVSYGNQDLVHLNDFTGPCDTIPICIPIATNDISPSAAIQIFPNPTQNKIYWSVDQEEVELINVQDNLGRNVSNIFVGTDYIDFKGTEPGIYFFSFRVGKEYLVKKILLLD